MNGIIYRLPDQNPQKGPTCWYYALKVLMKFHNFSDEKEEQFSHLINRWKELHQVRKAISGLKKSGLDYNNIENISRRLYGKLNLKEYKNNQDRNRVKSALAHTTKMSESHRMNFVHQFLGNESVRTLNIDPWRIEGLIRALKKNGPFYVSVSNAPHVSLFADITKDTFLDKFCVQIEKKDFRGGKHAMVIYGAIADKDRIYLHNPNDPSIKYCTHWEAISEQLNTPNPFEGNIIGVTVACNIHCQHLKNIIFEE
jgi:hypothetical protein